jgi:hypothetical protein
MAAKEKYWVGGTSRAPGTAANWSTGDVVEEGDTLVWNDQAQQGMDGADLSNATPVACDCIVEDNYIFDLGSSGTPFSLNGFTYLHFASGGTSQAFFGIGASGADEGFDNVIVDTPNQRDPALTLKGSIDLLTLNNGKVAIDSTSTFTAASYIQVFGGELTIPAGVTVNTTNTTSISSGIITSSVTMETVNVGGGQFILDGTAGVNDLVRQTGGEFIWDADSSTIALADVHGGTFRTRKNRITRVMTAMRMHNNAIVDFSIGGLNITFTAGIKKYGVNEPISPKGTKIAWSAT